MPLRKSPDTTKIEGLGRLFHFMTMWPNGKNRFPAQDDINEMKKNGYEHATIADAEKMMELGIRAQELCQAIQNAFADVKLGSGIGLREARGIDDHAATSALVVLRAHDEKEDWRKLPPEEFEGLAFFDAEGMRFHLPAFLIADLQGKNSSALWSLTFLDKDMGQFALLSSSQRSVVRAYLLLNLDDPYRDQDHAQIQSALDKYWIETPHGSGVMLS